MGVVFSVSWDDTKKRGRGRARIVLAVALAALMALPLLAERDTQPAGPLVSVIVRQLPGADARAAVVRAGGEVGPALEIIGGFAARVPAGALDRLRHANGVLAVTPNAPIQLHQTPEYDPATDAGSVDRLLDVIGARALWDAGITGAGVDVALIDSGVAPVPGLTTPGKVVNGPDLSPESQASNLRYLDTFGHGTHMAGLIAGRDDAVVDPATDADPSHFLGVAPSARIVSVKVADARGTTDVSQVIAGIDWVVQHRNDNGLNIRVLNLSFGTDGSQDHRVDPLMHAVEVAVANGIVVVVAAGNRGDVGMLDNPARDPYVIAVGAVDPRGTRKLQDDHMQGWSSTGNSERVPDLVAPGQSVASLRDPGSFIDTRYPDARAADRYFRGSGTSASAAFVSGAVALLLEQRPSLTPAQVKALLTATARNETVSRRRQGAGLLDLSRAATTTAPLVRSGGPAAFAPTGTLEGARGSHHIAVDGVTLEGERDLLGGAWTGGAYWEGGTWNGNEWAGGSWSGDSWSGPAWATATWTGESWSGNSWSSYSWSGNSWSGNSWSGNSWSGNSWSGNSWSGNSWSFGNSWSLMPEEDE